jgi:MFS transporter, UMF1 family
VAWALYDFGNSAFTTLVVTFIYATYFSKTMAPTEAEGTALWARGITITALFVAVLSPLTGAIADRGGLRKRLLLLSTLAVIVPTALLAGVPPGAAASALVLFIVANVAFELSGTFYNAFLPVIAAPERIGRVSGYGWGTGSIGGLLCMAVALVGFVGLSDASVPWFGLSREAGENIRATNVLVAAWMAVFCLPLFLWVPDPRPPHPSPLGHIVRDSFRQLRATFHSLRRYRHAVRFLIARLFFNDGLTTIFSFGGIYAAGTFGFSFTEILYFGLALNIAAGIGGFAFGAVDDRLGGKRTVMISLVGLAAAAAFALTTTSKSGLWIAGIVIGIFSGPNQAASRSLMGRFVPRGKENEFFGFLNFSGKATSFLGPLALGIITGATHSQRLGLSVVVVFFLVGLVLLTRVDEQEGIRLARQPLPPEDPAAP